MYCDILSRVTVQILSWKEVDLHSQPLMCRELVRALLFSTQPGEAYKVAWRDLLCLTAPLTFQHSASQLTEQGQQQVVPPCQADVSWARTVLGSKLSLCLIKHKPWTKCGLEVLIYTSRGINSSGDLHQIREKDELDMGLNGPKRRSERCGAEKYLGPAGSSIPKPRKGLQISAPNWNGTTYIAESLHDNGHEVNLLPTKLYCCRYK